MRQRMLVTMCRYKCRLEKSGLMQPAVGVENNELD